MLTQIDINHLATIQELHLELLPGTTVITGETGAGKSILIDAIALALGSRATGDMVRPGHDKADISISFMLKQLPDAKEWLKKFDLDTAADECIIRRTIHKDGRSRSYINGAPITLQILRELSDLLINIHGQHEHQALFKQDTQRDMLDRYAGHTLFTDEIAQLSREWHSISRTITELRKSNEERTTRSDFLRFQLNELEALQLKPDEFQALDLEHKQLANAGELLQNMDLALQLLSEQEDKNAMGLLNQALVALEEIRGVDPKISAWVENIRNAIIQLSDTESDLHHYLEHVDLDPERLKWVEERISILFDVARKHRVAPEELYDLQMKIAAELNELDNSDGRLVELEKNLAVVEKNIR